MKQAFIIMQIGNKELDSLYESIIIPAVERCGFTVKRVDKHNRGGLLKSEIVEFIGESEIIIADLTNERPNCYLEVGYAMGLGKYRNLILTARSDHYDRSPDYRSDGPRIHFDLTGYDIVFWKPEKLEKFKTDLIKKIKSRVSVVSKSDQTTINTNWLARNTEKAKNGLKSVDREGYLEFISDVKSNVERSPKDLLKASEYAKIHTFGWPIGVSLSNDPKQSPKPTADGIETEVSHISLREPIRNVYDFWAINKNCDMHLIKSIFEDNRKENQIFFDTRIIRITEIFLYLSRLYYSLELDPNTEISVTIRHGGLSGRSIGAANPRRFGFRSYESSVDVIETTIDTTIEGLETNILQLVKQVSKDLFTVFNFFEINDEILEPIVLNYIDGRIT